MNYVIVPVYSDDDMVMLDIIDQLEGIGLSDVHIATDAERPALEACLPTTITLDEQLVFELNQSIAMATAVACAERAQEKWGTKT